MRALGREPAAPCPSLAVSSGIPYRLARCAQRRGRRIVVVRRPVFVEAGVHRYASDCLLCQWRGAYSGRSEC